MGGQGKGPIVFQDPDDQLVMNRVVDDVAFGPENLGLPREEIEERVAFTLGMLGLDGIGDPHRRPLSGTEAEGRYRRLPGHAAAVSDAGRADLAPPVPVGEASDLHGQET